MLLKMSLRFILEGKEVKKIKSKISCITRADFTENVTIMNSRV